MLVISTCNQIGSNCISLQKFIMSANYTANTCLMDSTFDGALFSFFSCLISLMFKYFLHDILFLCTPSMYLDTKINILVLGVDTFTTLLQMLLFCRYGIWFHFQTATISKHCQEKRVLSFVFLFLKLCLCFY